MIKKINIGKTYNGVLTIPGLLILLVSFIIGIAQIIIVTAESINSLDWNYFMFAIIGFPIGQVLFIAKGGLAVDEKKESLMLYYSYFGIKIGHWRKIQKYDSVRIKRASETKNVFTKTGFHSMSYKTYDVMLNGVTSEIIKSFGDYEMALIFLKKVADLTGLNGVDEIALLKSSSLKRRKFHKLRRKFNV